MKNTITFQIPMYRELRNTPLQALSDGTEFAPLLRCGIRTVDDFLDCPDIAFVHGMGAVKVKKCKNSLLNYVIEWISHYKGDEALKQFISATEVEV